MLVCLSANHKNSSFDVLERLSVAGSSAARITDGHPSLSGAVVVATCNRFEAYLDLDEPFGVSPLPAVHAAIAEVSAATGIDESTLRETLDLVHGNAVAEHLFAVSSGLESVVVGEGEIAGQVRRALERARATGTTTPVLERLFQHASQASRGVKNRTGLGGAGRSLVRLALDLAESRVTDWTSARVLLIGTGQFAGASLAALRDRGAQNVRVYSPSGRALRFAANHNIDAVAAADYAVEAARSDVIITCTTADVHVLNATILTAGRAALGDTVSRVAAGPPQCPVTAGIPTISADTDPYLVATQQCPVGAVTGSTPASDGAPRQLVIDLGLPRNVDPDLAELGDVELLDLETVRLHAPLEALTATTEARAIVGNAARRFTVASAEQALTPAVVALRRHVFGVLEEEITRAKRRGDDDGRTEEALRHLTGVLLHTPMVRSREYARSGEHSTYLDGLEALFGIQVDGILDDGALPINAIRATTAHGAEKNRHGAEKHGAEKHGAENRYGAGNKTAGYEATDNSAAS